MCHQRKKFKGVIQGTFYPWHLWPLASWKLFRVWKVYYGWYKIAQTLASTLIIDFQLPRASIYSLCQKKRTFNSKFFRGTPLGRGTKNLHVRSCNINGHVNFWHPSPRGATKKIPN